MGWAGVEQKGTIAAGVGLGGAILLALEHRLLYRLGWVGWGNNIPLQLHVDSALSSSCRLSPA